MYLSAQPSLSYSTVNDLRKAMEEERRDRMNKYILFCSLRAKLGEGAFGRVFLAEVPGAAADEQTAVAIKVTPCGKIDSTFYGDLLASELRTLRHLSSLDSPFFPQLYAGLHDEFNYYVITNYLKGGSLRDEMERGALSSDRIRFVMAQLVVGLSQLRDASVIHRDLKPDNMMLDEYGNITIIDFGLARLFGSSVLEQDQDKTPTLGYCGSGEGYLKTQTRCGTLEYMAPEIVANLSYSFEVDVYALGIILYELLFDERPFKNDNINPKVIQQRILYSTWRVPDGVKVDPTALDVLGRLLEKRQYKRITLEELKAHAFFEGVDWDAVASRSYEVPTSFTPVMDKPPRGFMDHGKLIDPQAQPPPPFSNVAKMQEPLKEAFSYISQRPLVSCSRAYHGWVKKPWSPSAHPYVTKIEDEPVAVWPVLVSGAQSAKRLTPTDATPTQQSYAKSAVFSLFNCSIVAVDPFVPIIIPTPPAPPSMHCFPVVCPLKSSPSPSPSAPARPALLPTVMKRPKLARLHISHVAPTAAMLSPPALTISSTLTTSSGSPTTPAVSILKARTPDVPKKNANDAMAGTWLNWLKEAGDTALAPRLLLS